MTGNSQATALKVWLGVMFGVGVFAVWAATPRTPTVATAPSVETFGFAPAPGFSVERDVQYVDNVPRCILRLARAANPGGLAAYVEVVMDWCAGIE